MKIKNLLFAFLIITTSITFSQNEINFGVKGGVNFSGFHTGSSIKTNIVGMHIGGMAEYSISESFALQAEILYSSKGGTVFNNNPALNFDTKLHYLDIPIQGKYYFTEKMSFDFGTQVGFLVSSDGELESGGEIDLAGTKSVDFSVNGGFSYKFENNLVIQTRYNFGLTEVFENQNYKNSIISLTLGYYFN